MIIKVNQPAPPEPTYSIEGMTKTELSYLRWLIREGQKAANGIGSIYRTATALLEHLDKEFK